MINAVSDDFWLIPHLYASWEASDPRIHNMVNDRTCRPGITQPRTQNREKSVPRERGGESLVQGNASKFLPSSRESIGTKNDTRLESRRSQGGVETPDL
jgi:hypothetical protein